MTLKKSTQNPRYLEETATGKTVMLAGSHTWRDLVDIQNAGDPLGSAFNWTNFLNTMSNYGHNYFRLWIIELTQYSAAEGDMSYVYPFPWERTGPGNALDGKLKFDLNTPGTEFFNRLRTRCEEAQEKGIYVSIMFFEHWAIGTKIPWRWNGHPFNINNNINGINGDPDNNGYGGETHTLYIPSVTEKQKQYIRWVIDATNDLDNVMYEIINEPSNNTDANSWQEELINYIHTYELTKPKQHPVIRNSLVCWSDSSLWSSSADIIVPTIGCGITSSGPSIISGTRPVILDTDHIIGVGGNHDWVWKCFIRGTSQAYMDAPELTTYNGYNLVDARKALGDVVRYSNRCNMANMQPSDLISKCSTGYSLVDTKNGYSYIFYQPGSGQFTISINPDEYNYEWFDPLNHTIKSSGTITLSNSHTFNPPFSGHAVLFLQTTELSLSTHFQIEELMEE